MPPVTILILVHKVFELSLSCKIAATASMLVLILIGCVSTPGPQHETQSFQVTFLDSNGDLDSDWVNYGFGVKTLYSPTRFGDQIAIHAVGQKSASGIFHYISMNPRTCREIEWSWNATKIQASADLRSKRGDDVAASLFLLFGELGLPSSPNPVPTLRYVWTNKHHQVGAIFDNPYFPGIVRNIVLRAGPVKGNKMVVERRDVFDDFVKAFGRQPEKMITAVVLFTDNDQTLEPAEAYYGSISASCDDGRTDDLNKG